MPYADQQTMYDRIDELRQYDAEYSRLNLSTVFIKKRCTVGTT
ncbi:TPA: hypothetical protein ACIVDT_005034 [Salmonella enterica subsp. enterica serovar Eastbourne]